MFGVVGLNECVGINNYVIKAGLQSLGYLRGNRNPS